jgi:superfamily II DNA or RNA helicase
MKLRHWQSECISKALEKYFIGSNHFLCLATPGAGKTVMASTLANRLLIEKRIDLVLCFSPSVIVSHDFQSALEIHTNSRMDGLLGSKGRSLTYQAMLFLDDSFWKLFDTNRIFVIFDEIHHCAGDSLGNANSWGQIIIQKIQGRANYTLALTGTPWRSDKIPIALSSYCQNQRIHCDYVYGLAQAVEDNVCRTPQITLIDNDRITVNHNNQIAHFSSFEDLLKNSNCSYHNLIDNNEIIGYFVDKSSNKLAQLRKKHPDAGGLIVAASVEHANKIADILFKRLGEKARVATYREDDPQNIINSFKISSEKWIISVGMISEGTNIPRLRVCCHLTRVKTELHFRQLLGRILRNNNEENSQGFLYMPAEPNLIDYANRVAEEIPLSATIRITTMSYKNSDKYSSSIIDGDSNSIDDLVLFTDDNTDNVSRAIDNHEQCREPSILAASYESTINIFGKFRQELLSLPRYAS